MRILQTGVTHFDPDRATPGFTLFSPLWGDETLILDMKGEVVHRWEFPVMLGGYGRLLPNGNLFVAVSTPERPRFAGGAQGGKMQEVDWDGNVVNEFVGRLPAPRLLAAAERPHALCLLGGHARRARRAGPGRRSRIGRSRGHVFRCRARGGRRGESGLRVARPRHGDREIRAEPVGAAPGLRVVQHHLPAPQR